VINNSTIVISSSLIISFLLTQIITPRLIEICSKYNIKENPNERKEHKKPMIRLGGVGLLLSFQISLIILVNLNDLYDFIELNNSLILKIQIFSFLVSIIGIIDDLLNINAYLRLICQFSIAFLTWTSDIRIDSLYFIVGNNLSYSLNLNALSSCLITMLWLVGVINAINWIDGIDGLACSLIISSCLGFIILSILNNQFDSLILASSLMGPCLCFLIYNYYPAKLFMGDGGSNFLGFIVAIISIIYYSQNDSINFNPLQVSLLIAIPIFDMVYVILKRILSGHSPFLPDRSHFHHRLVNIGFNPRSILNFALFISIPLISLGIVLF